MDECGGFVSRVETRGDFLVLFWDEVVKRTWWCGMVGQKYVAVKFPGKHEDKHIKVIADYILRQIT